MFELCDDVVINQLVRVLRPQVLLKGDSCFKLNDPGDSIYFLKKGAVQIVNEGVIYCTLMPGSHFGELSMLTGQRRTAAATAFTDCIMFHMTSKDFDTVMNEFPNNYNDVLGQALERLDSVVRSNASVEVRMEHAVHKKRILERLSTSKIECLTQDSANGLTEAELDLKRSTSVASTSPCCASASSPQERARMSPEPVAVSPTSRRGSRGTSPGRIDRKSVSAASKPLMIDHLDEATKQRRPTRDTTSPLRASRRLCHGRSSQVHVEPSQGLPLPLSVASEAGGTKSIALCTTDSVSRTVPAMNCAEGVHRASQGDIKDALPDRGGDIREARCSFLHTQHPCVPSAMASYDRDDDGRCVGAL